MPLHTYDSQQVCSFSCAFIRVSSLRKWYHVVVPFYLFPFSLETRSFWFGPCCPAGELLLTTTRIHHSPLTHFPDGRCLGCLPCAASASNTLSMRSAALGLACCGVYSAACGCCWVTAQTVSELLQAPTYCCWEGSTCLRACRRCLGNPVGKTD